MPPIGWHVAVAKETLARLDIESIEEHLACYLLGATSPDIRVLTRQPREETHFYDLRDEHCLSGIPKLLEVHPHLLQVNGRAKAFLAGYITHLATDELWIEQVYRPFFGKGTTTLSRTEADVMDRVLQFYLDRAERLDRDRFKMFYDYVLSADPGEEVGFIEAPTMRQWREVVCRILDQDPSWENFKSFTLRRFSNSAIETEEQVKTLFESLPQVLERTITYVSPERVASFKEDAIQSSQKAVREHFS